MGHLTEEAGVRVDISNIGEMPFPLEQGISLAPGFATSVGMRKVRERMAAYVRIVLCKLHLVPIYMFTESVTYIRKQLILFL